MISSLPFSYSWIIKKSVEKFPLKNILELGCGKGTFADLVNKENKFKITGIEIFDPYIKMSKDGGKYEKVLKGDLTRKLPFKDKSFDAVACLQTIEHLGQKEGLALISEMERVAKKIVIITTPNGECIQDEYDQNKYQRHLSSWGVSDFEKKGYKVSGTGLKQAYGSHSHAGDEVGLTKMPIYLISFLMNPLAYAYPNIAAQLVAIKKCKK